MRRGAPPPPSHSPRAFATLAFQVAPSPPTPCRSLRKESFGVRSPFCHAGWASNSYLAARPSCVAARSRSAGPDPPYGRNMACRARPLRVPQRSRSGRAGLGLLIDGGSPAPETPARRAAPPLRWRRNRVGHPARSSTMVNPSVGVVATAPRPSQYGQVFPRYRAFYYFCGGEFAPAGRVGAGGRAATTPCRPASATRPPRRASAPHPRPRHAAVLRAEKFAPFGRARLLRRRDARNK